MQQTHAVFGELAHYGSEPFKSDTNVIPLLKVLATGLWIKPISRHNVKHKVARHLRGIKCFPRPKIVALVLQKKLCHSSKRVGEWALGMIKSSHRRGGHHGAPLRTRFRNPLEFTWISDFRMDFWISRWISGFQCGFLDFK